jgi:hypothetical protein
MAYAWVIEKSAADSEKGAIRQRLDLESSMRSTAVSIEMAMNLSLGTMRSRSGSPIKPHHPTFPR